MFVGNGPITNEVALDQILAWRRTGDRTLSEPLIVGIVMMHR